VVFSLASGNIARSFEIITTNDSIGEVFVARPLDREELDHYILKVGTTDCLRRNSLVTMP
jgi:protocadherin-15